MLQRLAQKLPKEQIAHLKQHWLTVSFVFGFIGDIILLNQIDSVVDNLILLFNATTATVSFLLLYVAAVDRLPKWLSNFFRTYAPMAMQYGFGGLLSGMLVFYGRSGDWLASAPFLLVIVTVIFGNEFIKKRSDKFLYHLALYYIGIFSYIVLLVPVVLGKMGDSIFILSGFIALALVGGVVQLLYHIVPNFMMANTKRIILTMGFVYIGFNALYFANIIPPIPLSLTKLEVTHGVVRLDTGNYRVVYEEQPLWRTLLPPIIHPEGTVACFARVYAPTRLTTNIYHRWEFKNADGKWQEHARISYQVLSSGTLAGYRGYTQIISFNDGEWRCSVETARGAVLGRETFYIKTSGTPGTLVTRIE